MPYDLFWHLNPAKLEPFRKAYQKKLEQDNYNAWLQGSYIRIAIASAMDKKCEYPDSPYCRAQETEGITEMNSAEIASKQFEAWTKVFNKKFEN